VGGLGTTYDVHLGLIGKRVVDFLLVLIEGVTVELFSVIPYYHKIFIFAVLERWLIYECETECSFVYSILLAAAVTSVRPQVRRATDT